MNQSKANRFARYFLAHFGSEGSFTVGHLDPEAMEALAREFTSLNQFVSWAPGHNKFNVLVIPAGVSLR